MSPESNVSMNDPIGVNGITDTFAKRSSWILEAPTFPRQKPFECVNIAALFHDIIPFLIQFVLAVLCVSKVDDDGLRGGVASAEKNIARVCVIVRHAQRKGGDRLEE